MKTCFKCRREKPLAEFYRHPAMGDGYLGKCKECTKRDVRENYQKNREHYLAYEKQRANLPHRALGRERYSKSPNGKAAARQRRVKWLANNMEKRAAHVLLGSAVASGRVVKKPCEVCGSTTRIHGHHDDYGKPLEVTWLCPKHHAARHKELKAQKK